MNHPFWGTTIFGNIQVFQDWFDWFLRPSTTFATGAASSMSNSAGVPGYSALRHDFQGCGKMLEKGMFQFVEGGGMWFFEWFFFGTCLFFLHGFLLLLVSDLEDSCDRNVESSETELHPIEMPLATCFYYRHWPVSLPALPCWVPAQRWHAAPPCWPGLRYKLRIKSIEGIEGLLCSRELTFGKGKSMKTIYFGKVFFLGS